MPAQHLLGYTAVGCLMTMATAYAIQNQFNHDETAVKETAVKETAVIKPKAAASPDDPGPLRQSRLYPVVIRIPEPPQGVETVQIDYQGNAIRLACRSCHDVRPANVKTSRTGDLNEFHQGLVFNHGKLACVACHNAQDGFTTLHLADGRAVEYADTMNLCAQCHGPQFRDYQHGTHGGMTGYWDLTKGPRRRNHCIDCHDPHSPQYPAVYPAAGPNDRFAPSHKDAVH